MMSKVDDFNADAQMAKGLCVWPMCDKKVLIWVKRVHDSKRLGHCARHHFLIVYSPTTHAIIQPKELDISCWEDEGGSCENA